jgi:hypothetical protein
VESAVFTNPNVQNQIDKLSKRSHGIKDDSQDERVHSDLKGSFKLGDGSIYFSQLSFMVPGAQA